ncbi:MAG: nucleosidase [Solirubrobacterales bacterium]
MQEIEIHGQVEPGRPLLVVALHEEGVHLRRHGLPLLVCGPGKVNAALGVSRLLAGATPSEVINLGTAGSLRDGLHGTHVVGRVTQHDFDEQAILALTGRDFGGPVALGDGPTLTTGDRFVADSAVRAQLAGHADLVDMEGYAIASAAAAAGVPVRLVKHVSDDGDEQAATSWSESVEACAERLSDWLAADQDS